MGTEGKNREQRRKLNKGRAHASKATAIVMAGLMATSGISLPAGTLAFASEMISFWLLRGQKVEEDSRQVAVGLMFML